MPPKRRRVDLPAVPGPSGASKAIGIADRDNVSKRFFSRFYEWDREGVSEKKKVADLFSESDVARISEQGRIPLSLPESEGWIRIHEPFSFETVIRVFFGHGWDRSGAVGIAGGNIDALTIFEPEDDAKTCLEKLSSCTEIVARRLVRRSEVFGRYKNDRTVSMGADSATRPTLKRKWWADECEIESSEKELEKLSSALFSSGMRASTSSGTRASTSLSRKTKAMASRLTVDHVRLSRFLYGDSTPARYHALISSLAAVSKNNDGDIRSRYETINLICRYQDDEPLTYGRCGDGERVFYVKGCPCNVKHSPWKSYSTATTTTTTRLVKVETGVPKKNESGEKNPDVWNVVYGVPVEVEIERSKNDDDDRTVLDEAGQKRISRVISSLCHLELFGQPSSEREVSVKVEELTKAMAIETALYETGAVGTRSAWNEHRHPTGARESPFSAFSWNQDTECLERGYAFANRFLEDDVDGDSKRRAPSFSPLRIALGYAILYQTLTPTAGDCSDAFKYRGNAPQIGSYAWKVTTDGTLYYQKRRFDDRKRSTTTKIAADEKFETDGPLSYVHHRHRFGVKSEMLPTAFSSGELESFSAKETTAKIDPSGRESQRRRGSWDDFDPREIRRYDGRGRFSSSTGFKDFRSVFSKKKLDPDARIETVLMDGESMNGDCTSVFEDADFSRTASPTSSSSTMPPGLEEAMDFAWVYLQICSDLALVGADEENGEGGFESGDVDSLFSKAEGFRVRGSRGLSLLESRRWLEGLLLPPGKKFRASEFDDPCGSDPLWMQACFFVASESKRKNAICRTFANVPASLKNVCFSAAYRGVEKTGNCICLGHVDERSVKFIYRLFWYELVFGKGCKYVHERCKIWELFPEITANDEGGNTADRFSRTVSAKRISERDFDKILKISVFYVVNDDLW
jgi:hypothetical protein